MPDKNLNKTDLIKTTTVILARDKMVNFKICILPIVLVLFTTPDVESGFVLDKLRGLAHGFCNLFNKQSPEPTEKTHLFADNIRMETSKQLTKFC